MWTKNPNPTIKPPFGSVIDPDHPLAQGLVGCYLVNESSGRRINELVTGSDITNFVGNSSLCGTGLRGTVTDGSDFASTSIIPKFLAKDLSEITVVVFAEIKAFDVYGTSFFVHTRQEYYSHYGFTFYSYSGYVAVRIGTTDSYYTFGTNSLTQDDVVGHDGLFGFSLAPDVCNFFIDGVTESVANSDGLPILSNQYPLSLGSFDGLTFAVYLFDRAKGFDWFKEIAAEPYAFILWPARRSIFDFGAVTIPSSAAPLTATGTVTTTGQAVRSEAARVGGTGAVAATGRKTGQDGAPLAAAGVVTTTGQVATIPGSAAPVTAAGSVTTVGAKIAASTAMVSAVGSTGFFGIKAAWSPAPATATTTVSATGQVVAGSGSDYAPLTAVATVLTSGRKTGLSPPVQVAAAGAVTVVDRKLAWSAAPLSGSGQIVSVGINPDQLPVGLADVIIKVRLPKIIIEN